MVMVRHLSTLAALALHAAGIGIVMSTPPGAPAAATPREIPITLTMTAPPEPPAPRVEQPKPEPKPEPKPVVNEASPPPVPQPLIEPPPQVIASAATSVAETVVPVMPPPPPPPPPNPSAVKAQEDYFSRVLAWLERHKRYPGEARSRRAQGTAMVWFVMDRQGRVQGSKLQKTSGHPMLDEAAVKMVQRASPLPAMPAEMPDQTVELVVPVEFYIR